MAHGHRKASCQIRYGSHADQPAMPLLVCTTAPEWPIGAQSASAHRAQQQTRSRSPAQAAVNPFLSSHLVSSDVRASESGWTRSFWVVLGGRRDGACKGEAEMLRGSVKRQAAASGASEEFSEPRLPANRAPPQSTARVVKEGVPRLRPCSSGDVGRFLQEGRLQSLQGVGTLPSPCKAPANPSPATPDRRQLSGSATGCRACGLLQLTPCMRLPPARQGHGT